MGIIIKDKGLSILDTLNDEMISKVFWSMHHSVKSAEYSHYIDNRNATVYLKDTDISFKKIDIGIKENKKVKEDLEILEKEMEKSNLLINASKKSKIELDYLKSLRKEINKKVKEDLKILEKEMEKSNLLINASKKAKIELDYLKSLRKEIANVILAKNINMGDYQNFVHRTAEENLD